MNFIQRYINPTVIGIGDNVKYRNNQYPYPDKDDLFIDINNTGGKY